MSESQPDTPTASLGNVLMEKLKPELTQLRVYRKHSKGTNQTVVLLQDSSPGLFKKVSVKEDKKRGLAKREITTKCKFMKLVWILI